MINDIKKGNFAKNNVKKIDSERKRKFTTNLIFESFAKRLIPIRASNEKNITIIGIVRSFIDIFIYIRPNCSSY